MEERSWRDAEKPLPLGGGTEVAGRGAGGMEGRVPGWRDWRPRGVSRVTRKWPVKGGERAEGRWSGSILSYGVSTKTQKKDRTDLVVDQAPLLKKSMDAHDGADVAGKVAATGSDGEILCWAQTIGVHHKVAVVLVYGGGFGPVTRVEELGEGTSLDGVDLVHAVPGSVAGDDDLVRLRCEVLASLVLETEADGLELGRVVVDVVVIVRVCGVFATVSHDSIWAVSLFLLVLLVLLIVVIVVVIVVVVIIIIGWRQVADVGGCDGIQLTAFAWSTVGNDGDGICSHGRRRKAKAGTNKWKLQFSVAASAGSLLPTLSPPSSPLPASSSSTPTPVSAAGFSQRSSSSMAAASSSNAAPALSDPKVPPSSTWSAAFA